MKILFLAATALVVGTIGIYFIIIQPQIDTTREFKEELAILNDTRFLLRTTNIDSIMQILQKDIHKYTAREKRFLNQPLRLEQVPLFISKLEKEAIDNGLVTSSELQKPNTDDKDSANKRHITLLLEGTFLQVMAFLENINNWERAVLVEEFKLSQNIKSKELLVGVVDIVVTIAK